MQEDPLPRVGGVRGQHRLEGGARLRPGVTGRHRDVDRQGRLEQVPVRPEGHINRAGDVPGVNEVVDEMEGDRLHRREERAGAELVQGEPVADDVGRLEGRRHLRGRAPESSTGSSTPDTDLAAGGPKTLGSAPHPSAAAANPSCCTVMWASRSDVPPRRASTGEVGRTDPRDDLDAPLDRTTVGLANASLAHEISLTKGVTPATANSPSDAARLPERPTGHRDGRETTGTGWRPRASVGRRQPLWMTRRPRPRPVRR